MEINQKEDIVKFIKKFSMFIVVLIIVIFSFLILITQIYNKKFRTSYQYAINLKYNNLINTDSPKIIIVGGSSSAFGINTDVIEEITGKKVVNLGLHAGFGTKFQTELAKTNIKEEDLIVLAYEYPAYMYGEDGIEHFSPELVTTGIDDNLQIYKYIPNDKWKDILKYIPTYVFKKLDVSAKTSEGDYSINSFDKCGNMIIKREECILPKKIDTKTYSSITVSAVNLSKESINYINNFYNYCKSKKANVVITFPPALDETFYGTEEEIKNLENSLKANLKPTVISNISDYIFPRQYMYDTIYHCNSIGEKIRSEKLAKDINNYINNI